MSDDLPPDLERLRILETWHALTLERIQTAIKAIQQREAIVQERIDRRARIAQEPPRPPREQWVLQLSIGVGPPVALHTRDCDPMNVRNRGVGRAEALQALTAGVEPCPFCRPDTELGYLG